ncbi:variable surface protein Vir12-like [Plasmodium vivax]|uniref:Variable surface protein Vir12-like n=1 Tax=Plasmodium vivax (strain Salvador I) TaxID=126793 RepID=A5K693_PLAVS|nr:variable surface protein Vir12-like [Plasmodium vivax]EDL45428.1 variable surface protein Vir12-like [Plasmodium vivax]|eukprot:XP_001615155.1 variable surface protein Vir12-like [Plasmodium vivax Sal-1]
MVTQTDDEKWMLFLVEQKGNFHHQNCSFSNYYNFFPIIFQEAAAKQLKLDNMYDIEFFSKKGNPKNSTYCNVFTVKTSTDTKAKELCSTLIYHLENIGEKKPQSDNYCNYLRYWLYDEIGKIHTNQSDKVEKIPFLKNLIDAWYKINRDKLKYACSSPYVNGVSLKELKTRKLSYIYFKNEDNIQKISMSKDTAVCSKYLTYIQSFSSLYDKYKKTECVPGIFFSAVGSHHFPCKHKYEIKALISALEDCKKGILPRNLPAAAGAAVSGRDGSRTAASSLGGGGAGGSRTSQTLTSSTGSVGSRSSQALTSSTSLASSRGPTTLASAGGPGRPASVAGVTNGADRQAPSSLQPKASLSATPSVVTGHGGLGASPPTLQTGSDTGHVDIAGLPGSSESASDKMDSNFYRNIIMAAAILGTIFFLFFYNKFFGLKTSFPKRKRKKKIFEHNYYEEYEKELARYDSENESLDSQSDRYYLNYQPDEDSYY